MSHTVEHTLEHGIERIIYTPDRPRFSRPILMQHGMWHGAWCWRWWQELLADWGWTSIAISLPGHGQSPVQRPIRLCTLGYYLRFLRAEVERLPERPVLMGHSMGGALTQWYLRYAADDLPAAVLVAPWPSHNIQSLPILKSLISLSPLGYALSFLTLSADPMVRTPRLAGKAFITPGAVLTPEELHARLGPESALVSLQYRPPLWRPAENVKTPMLWLAGEQDTLIPESEEAKSARHYGATYVVVPEAGHNLMLEKSYRATAETIHEWLAARVG